jgi:DNA-binding HxlR family transcriptional regulator
MQVTGVPRSICPVACALDVFGDRWTLLVMRDLFAGHTRFGDFLRSAEHIPTNILADRLKRLQRAGLIEAVPYTTRPVRYHYQLTRAGRDLAPVLRAIGDWGLAHVPGTRVPDEFLTALARA